MELPSRAKKYHFGMIVLVLQHVDFHPDDISQFSNKMILFINMSNKHPKKMSCLLLIVLPCILLGAVAAWYRLIYRKPKLDIPSKDHVVVVSGAGGGFGSEICRQLVSNKWNARVIAIDVKKSFMERAFETELKDPKMASRMEMLECDIASNDHVERTAQEIKSILQKWNVDRVFALVNNAGIANSVNTKSRCGVVEYSEDELEQVFGVNVLGHARMLRTLYPVMKKTKKDEASSIVINVASVAGFYATRFFGFYAATKFAMVGLSDSLRREFKVLKDGLRVTCIEPGFSRTNIINLKPVDEKSEWATLMEDANKKVKPILGNAQPAKLVADTICDQIFSSNNLAHVMIDYWYMNLIWNLVYYTGFDI